MSNQSAAQQIVAGEPRLRILHQAFIFSGCRDSRGHLNSAVIRLHSDFAKMIIKKLVAIACLLLTLYVTLNAKVPQAPAAPGKLTGMVLDPAKLYVPGATIIIKGRRVRRELYSADDGSYSVELPPGTYIVRIAHPGFLPFRRRVQIKPNDVAKLDVIFRLNPRLFAKTWIVTRRG